MVDGPPQHDDVDNLYEHTESPYQWELNENPSLQALPGKVNDINGSAPVVSSGNSVDVRVKENGGVSS